VGTTRSQPVWRRDIPNPTYPRCWRAHGIAFAAVGDDGSTGAPVTAEASGAARAPAEVPTPDSRRRERRPPAVRPSNNWPAPAVVPQRPVPVHVDAASVELPPAAPPRPAAPPTTIRHERVVTGETAEALYRAYVDSFEPLAELAVLKHLDSKADVLGLLANPRIVKIVAWQADQPVGLAMVTNSLDDVVEISPRFLRAKYPEYAARNAIYIGMLVMVSKQLRGLTVFNRLYTELWQVPAQDAGILVFDVCEFNRTTFDVDSLSQRIASLFPRSNLEMLDRQTWYVAELPEPIPNSPAARPR